MGLSQTNEDSWNLNYWVDREIDETLPISCLGSLVSLNTINFYPTDRVSIEILQESPFNCSLTRTTNYRVSPHVNRMGLKDAFQNNLQQCLRQNSKLKENSSKNENENSKSVEKKSAKFSFKRSSWQNFWYTNPFELQGTSGVW